ncbi:hypothetical protein ABT337_17790 [Saccharopolyspora hirsuta]|uniref:hypothetical protein n=1 Tax=Saccharopolyspora hirsuta TaxID=1837 RepID=UPI003330CE1C
MIIVAVSLGQGGFEWMADPIPWVMIGIAAIITLARDWNTRLVAGADWLRVNRRWIDTYRIKDIKLYGIIAGWTLRLEDTEGRKVRVYIGTLETNRELWALVYNGLAHSIKEGATVNALAANMIELRRFANSG